MVEILTHHLAVTLGIVSALLLGCIALLIVWSSLRRWLVPVTVLLLVIIFCYLVSSVTERRAARRRLDLVMNKIEPVMRDALVKADETACDRLISSNPQIYGIKLFPNGLDSRLCVAGSTGEYWPEDFERSKLSCVDQVFTMDGQRLCQRIGCLQKEHHEVVGYYVLTVRERAR